MTDQKQPFYVGVSSWSTDTGTIDVVFASGDRSVVPGCVYAIWGTKDVHARWVQAHECLEAIDRFIDLVDLSAMDVYYALELSHDGWGLFRCGVSDERWELINSYDRIAQQETNMADQAHINDLRFGSDGPNWHGHPTGRTDEDST